ncbi:hypothetical protein N0V93_008366 [Gnomoniopsis smithogilvyi]|uniref:RNA ligase domain-containing protein n=1 Tax=Gnomoniopsis smithogilvyi TaxID=1191159 RepID=A0A9W9CTM1_9PEZI|nr:hypothetical protein N0V93_008366 [Gnomoniopsis smithogilvyi]
MSVRLVSVRKAKLVMPVMGHPDKVLITVDGFQVCVPSSMKIKPGELVLLFRSNTFLPASTPEFADLQPQTEYNGELGFVIHPSAPLLVNGKVKPIFNGLVVPVSDFPVVAMHIKQNKGNFNDDEGLCNALRNTTTFQTYLNVIEYHPGTSAFFNNPRPNTASDGSCYFDDTSSSGLHAFPPPQPLTGRRIARDHPHSIIGFRPYFCTKLDMINMQDIRSLFYGSKSDTRYTVTTFMVGSPMSVYFVRNNSRHAAAVQRAIALPNGRMGVCSRTLDLHEHNKQYPLHWAIVKKLGLPAALNRLNRSVVVHGVLVGSSIRDNYEGMAPGQHDFLAYAIADIDAPNDNTLTVGQMAPTGPLTWRLLTEKLGVRTVPQQEDSVLLSELAVDHDGIMALADGPGWFVEKRAGLVFRNVNTGRGFKVMSPEYIQRYGESSIRNDTQKSDWQKME